MDNNTRVSINLILERIHEGYYDNKLPYPSFKDKLKDDYVFDEDLSVKKNREMVAAHNAKISNSLIEYNNEEYRLSMLFREDSINAIVNDSVCELNTKQADIIYRKAYEIGHSSGYTEVINYISEELEYVNELFNA